MSALLPYLVNWLQEYGYPALWGLVFVGAAGVPLPITLLLLAAGAFAVLGDYNLGLLVALAMSAAVAGDSVGYSLGRRWGSRLLDYLEHSPRRWIPQQALSRARQLFHKRGGWAIFLGRTVFSAIGVPITLLSGAERYPYRKFLLFDALGELVGVGLPLSLGFLFGASWEAVGEILGTISLLLLALALATWLSYHLLLLLRRLRATHTEPQPQPRPQLEEPERATSPGAAPGSSGSLPL
ncbi:MAG: DedA family protein [Thermogemmatispora sp.]|uniref:DedA family protein n=1 Tax=Thermogemmatispora sp. TaxID=1968838 RepID=UPI0026359947|nr:DedA family protein [Thermogemmatispora sp.]MBX5457238.1 DedA family protein [Thermogemmatispora sp.]